MSISSRYKNIPENFRRYVPSDKGKVLVNEQIHGTHGSYQDELFNVKWIGKRKAILKRDNFKCRNCGSAHDLEVHHRQYHYLTEKGRFKEPWDYEDDLLITLCKTCNQSGLSRFKIPTKKL